MSSFQSKHPIYLALNPFFRWVILSICLFPNSLLVGQSFVKKDSSEIIPFYGSVYYNDNFEKRDPLSNKTNGHRNLSNAHSRFQDGVLFGSYGSTLFPFLYENKFYKNLNLGKTQLNSYSFDENNIPYYLINKPLSELDFIFFGNGNEEFKGFLSQNLSKNLNIGIGIRRSNNKGFFPSQENLHNNVYFQFTYQKNRIRSNVEFYYNDLTQNENGGMTFSIYDSLVASQWQNATPRLTKAVNRTKEFNISWRNRILIASAAKIDTTIFDTFLMKPIKSSLYVDINSSYGSQRITYFDQLNSSNRTFYEIYAADTLIQALESKLLNYRLQNKTSITYSIPNRLKVAGYSIVSNNSLSQKTKLDSNLLLTNNIIAGLGGTIDIIFPYNLQLSGELFKPIIGYTNQDFLLKGELNKSIQKTSFSFLSQYTRQLPGYFNNYMSCTSLDNFYQFKTQNTFENSLSISNRSLNLELKAQSFLIEDFLIYDTLGRPNQVLNNFIQLSASKIWGFKFLHLPTSIYFQNSIFPRTFIRQTIAYRNNHFNNKLNLILGFDILLNLQMPSMRYQPFLSESLYNPMAANSKLFPKIDFFATMKISKVHLSFIIDNLFSTYLKNGTNYSQNAPLTPSAFYLRSTWSFLE